MFRVRNHSPAVLSVLFLLLYCANFSHAQWKPAGAKLMTRWGKALSPGKVHQEYPRPQLVRADWANLNGLWDYAIRPATEESPEQADGKILVPFPVESALSGVGRMVGKEKRLWYRRTFEVPESWKGRRVLLHFGAVDWEAKVWVNGKSAGNHRGGYDPFSFDVTGLLTPAGGSQRLEVSAWDPSDEGPQPRGKQVSKPRGIWYTPVTGIWQTVWLEAVPLTSIEALHILPDVDGKKLKVKAATLGPDKVKVKVSVPSLGIEGEGAPGDTIELALKKFELWSPAQPKLYDLEVELLSGGKTVDRVESYFGMRKISLGPDQNGIPRILLNGEPLFQFGPLDQGWWPDGLYTAPSDEALRYDLEVTKKLGFNMVRKHVKVEPLRWYYHCDRMGLLVWQDMPNGGVNARWPLDGTELRRAEKEKVQFDRELDALIDSHRNQVSIVAWVPFNEAWGQFDSARVTRHIEEKDPGRLVISASGGNDFGIGHVHDIHQYPGPRRPPAETARAAVLGEYGGLGLPLKGHTWQNEKNWGYRTFKNRADLQKAYLGLIDRLRPMVESCLSAAIYTQTTDVEVEVNGLMSYDREVLKFDAGKLAEAHQALYAPLRKLSDAERSRAYTVAYWRFEDTAAGKLVPHDRKKRDAIAVRDVSGQRNHLYAFAAGNAPRAGAGVPARTIPRLELENGGVLDDSLAGKGATRDLYTNPGRSRTHMNVINTFAFTEWTVEASIQPVELGRRQTIVGEDGKPTEAASAPLQLELRKDNRIAIVAIDSGGEVRTVASRDPVEKGKWYHVAAMSDGSKMRLYLVEGNRCHLQGSTDFAGSLINHGGTWTVGRGFYDGRIALDARARIDEVRVSSIALPLELLLWHSSSSP